LKKIVLLTFVPALILSMTFVIHFSAPVKAETKTWTVDDDGPADFQTIQEAVNAAKPGDTVFVYNGTYQEWNIVLDKDDLSLIGENKDNTIIDGMNYGWILTITAQNVTVTGFTIQKSSIGTAGVFLSHTKECRISNNLVRNHDSGIYAVYSNNNVIEKNWVANNNEGIILSIVCKENKIMDNNVTGNTLYAGIDVSNGAHSNQIENNEIIQNKYGILITSENNSIFGNLIMNNDVGIYEYSESTRGYKIFHNNFVNNTQQIDLGSRSANIWDNGLEGNYWSDYNGTDFNQDGVGDTSYIINGNNMDYHPLMGTFSEFAVTLEVQTFHVTTICNSTISAFQSDQVNKIMRFNVTGEKGIGFCRVCTPYDLVPPPHTVTIDNGQTPVLYYNHSIYDNGTHRWIHFAYEHSTHEVLIRGTTPPTISIISPENKTYTVKDILLAFTVSEPTLWISYSLDDQMNVTVTGNTTLSTLSDGSHSLKVYAKDTAGNMGASEIICFSIETQQEEAFPTWIVAAMVIIAVVGATLLVYFSKVKKTTAR